MTPGTGVRLAACETVPESIIFGVAKQARNQGVGDKGYGVDKAVSFACEGEAVNQLIYYLTDPPLSQDKQNLKNKSPVPDF